MSRDWKRSSRHLEFVLAMAVLTSCGVAPPARAEQELEARDSPLRHEHNDDEGDNGGDTGTGDERLQVHTVRSAEDTDAPVAVAHDAPGNVLTLGNHRTPIDFGQGALGSSAGAPVLAVSKCTPDGQLSWVRILEAPPLAGTSPFVRGQALAVERQGTLLVLGTQSGGLEIGGSVLPPGAFLARLDAEGNPLWARALPTSATKLAVDKRGYITLAGMLVGQVDFGKGPPVTGTGNPYLVQFDATGAPRWVFVDSARGLPMDLALDDSGDLYLSGGRFLPPSLRLTPFLTHISSEGKPLWTRQLEGALGLAMSVAAQGGHVVVSGYFTGRFVFRGAPLLAPTSRGFALTYDRDGDERWGVLLGSTWGLVAMGPDSGVVVAGRYTGGEDFGLGLGPLEGYPGATNLYVLRLHRLTGKLQGVHTHASASALPVDLSVGSEGEGALTGTFRAPVDLGTGPLNPLPGGNAFLLQWEH
ncbi:hypothetical protein [Vitiosangium sp. GDMCC 1.1324]|uniref:hypothetical protein n=1 Tax=Vitiosangium sp. (strain GDMCC 1.1324) TaxID=2138576 RepID=UPI000D3D793C|nr:hypothetical protein [Vitiosangium sp. GDMCC 1.1324]PTL83330.1 hypothetical protein DAT35_15215 [Vitiosangium sp. GDMCC 1.1324]